MKKLLPLFLITGLLLQCKVDKKRADFEHPAPTGTENRAYQWGRMALTATANDTERF